MLEPWDDSALINAFNSAIAKYKTMHGIGVKDKTVSQDVAENFVHMESDTRTAAKLNEHDMEHSELTQKEENGGVPLAHADKLSPQEEGHTENNVMEEVPGGHSSYTYPQYYAQHHGDSATAENCYLCQWNAYYYQQAGAWASPATCGSNGYKCQYCGFVNQCDDSSKTHHQTQHTPQIPPDASAFPDIVKAAVAEALKAADDQNSTGASRESLQANTSFSDVAVAWFLAGFHTSRYLSQSK